MQQQGDKNNAELRTKWTKKTRNNFEEASRRGRNLSIKVKQVTVHHDNDDDDN